MKPINLIFDIKRDMHDYVELMQGYSYSFECEFYDDGIEFDLTGYNMSVDMLLANGDYDFRVSSKVVSGNKVTFNTDVISDYTGDAKLQILLDKNGTHTGSWLVNCKVKPSVLNEVKNTDFVTDLKQTIKEGKDLYDKGGVATKQDVAEINVELSKFESDIKNTNNFLETYNSIYVFVKDFYELKSVIENHNGIKYMEVIMLSGIYLFESRIVVNSNTKIKAQAMVVCKWKNKIANDNTFFLTKQSEDVGNYDSTFNIEFDGLSFDGEGLTSNFCFIALGHCSDITIKKCEFSGFNNAWHCLEVNSTKRANICENLFYDNNLTVEGTELIQIDNAHDSSRFPWGGLYDATPCCDINIINNTFLNSNSVCIGTHSSTQGKKHKHISVKDNKVKSVNTFIYAMSYEQCTITNNNVEDTSVFLTSGSGLDSNDKFEVLHNMFDGNNKEVNGVGHFIRTLTTDTSHCNDWSIINNKIKNVAQTSISITGTRLVINDNDIILSGWAAIHLYGCRASIVDGNVLSDSKCRGGQTVYGDLTLGVNPAIKNENNIITNNYISIMCVRSDDDAVFMGNLMLASRDAYQMTRARSNYIGGTYWEYGVK